MKKLYKIILDWIPTIKYLFNLKFLRIYITIIVKDLNNESRGTLVNLTFEGDKQKQKELLIKTYGEEYNEVVINNIITCYEMIKK